VGRGRRPRDARSQLNPTGPASGHNAMHDIDFLPAEYRQRYARRHSKPWRLLVLGAFAVAISVAALGQHRGRVRLDGQLAEIVPQYEAVVTCSQDLKLLESRLELSRADAELFTYLRHRWPTTQVLDALLARLPEEITFEQLEIRQETPQGQMPAGPLSREQREAETERTAALPPGARQLQSLRLEYDVQRTVITVTGLTSDSASLHRYLGELGQVELFAEAELQTIERDQMSGTSKLRFSASLEVQPGYGQPGGPTQPAADPAESMDDFRTARWTGSSPGVAAAAKTLNRASRRR